MAAAFAAVLSCSSSLGGEESRTLTLFFTGFVRGGFEPCGCSAGPVGGLSRRAGYARQYQERNPGPAVQIDAGNYFEPLGPYSDVINGLMLEGLDRLPIRVLNLATEDLFFWKELSKAELPLTQIISSNLIPLDQSIRRPATYAIVEVASSELHLKKNLRIGFLGLSDPEKVKPNSRFSAGDPSRAVEEVKTQMSPQADFLVVLADLSRETALRLAEAHAEIRAVILAEERYTLHPAERVNNAIILSSVPEGRYLGQLVFHFGPAGEVVELRSEFMEMKEGVPEEPTLLLRQQEVGRDLPRDAR